MMAKELIEKLIKILKENNLEDAKVIYSGEFDFYSFDDLSYNEELNAITLGD